MNARKMIKAVIFGIAAAAALSVSGCSDGNKAPDQGAVQKESPLMQKIKKQGKLVVGTASGYPPYEFIDTSVGEKKVIGIDMALAQKIADELGGETGSAGYEFPGTSHFVDRRKGGYRHCGYQSDRGT